MNTNPTQNLAGLRSLRSGKRVALTLGDRLAEGGEAIVYKIKEMPTLLAKVYKAPSQVLTAKVRAMLSSPPRQDRRRPVVVWPWDGLISKNDQTTRAVIIPYISESLTLLEVMTPKLRTVRSPGVNRLFLARVARNLAVAVNAVHSSGHVIGDLNEMNVLVRNDASVVIIDSDSFSIWSGQQRFPCEVGRPEYSAPELLRGTMLAQARSRHQDYFGLAILIFKVLMDGRHPFDGRDMTDATIEDRIRRGRFPHALPVPPGLAPPPTQKLARLPGPVAQLFRRAFVDGDRRPDARPTPAEWERTLAQWEPQLGRMFG